MQTDNIIYAASAPPPAYAQPLAPAVTVTVARIALAKLESTPQWHAVSWLFVGLMSFITFNNVFYTAGIDDEARRFLFVIMALQAYAAINISVLTRNNSHADLLEAHAQGTPLFDRASVALLRGTAENRAVTWAVMATSTTYAFYAIWTSRMDAPVRWSMLVTNFATVVSFFLHAKTTRDRADAASLAAAL